jgi:hypothetical protein
MKRKKKRRVRPVEQAKMEYFTVKEYLAMKGIEATPELVAEWEIKAKKLSEQFNHPVKTQTVEEERMSIRRIEEERVLNLLERLSNGK